MHLPSSSFARRCCVYCSSIFTSIVPFEPSPIQPVAAKFAERSKGARRVCACIAPAITQNVTPVTVSLNIFERLYRDSRLSRATIDIHSGGDHGSRLDGIRISRSAGPRADASHTAEHP